MDAILCPLIGGPLDGGQAEPSHARILRSVPGTNRVAVYELGDDGRYYFRCTFDELVVFADPEGARALLQ